MYVYVHVCVLICLYLVQVVEDFQEQSFCMVGPGGAGGRDAAAAAVKRTQSGVFRINCIDCLDRTNVVQGVLARKVCGQGVGSTLHKERSPPGGTRACALAPMCACIHARVHAWVPAVS